VALVVLAALIVAWLGLPSGDDVRLPALGPEEAPTAEEDAAALREPDASAADSERSELETDVGETDVDSSTAETSDASTLVGLTGRFVLPDRNQLRLDHAVVVLVGESGERRETEVRDAAGVFVLGLVPDRYRVSVQAEGHVHREQVVDLTSDENLSSSRSRSGTVGRVYEHRLTLWPEGWIAVVVRTTDGRPFTALADDLGLEPKRIFVGAFEARTRLDPPAEGAWEEPVDPEPATFRPAPGYQQWELPGSCVGSLRLEREPPFWVGLGVHGVLVGWELLSPGENEVRFRIDVETLETRFATLTLRVVDAEDGGGLPDALVTLRADTSAHRRGDLHDVSPDAEGRVVIERIVPGLYELSVNWGEAIHQDRPTLEPGGLLDLGTITMDAGAGFQVLAVREDGEPVGVWVEIGPYRTDVHVRDLYPPMLSRRTDRDGACRLPTPSGPSVVRATVYTHNSYPTDEQSANTLVDPAAMPSGALRLVVHEPLGVQFEADVPKAVTVRVLDELELVVEELSLTDGDPRPIDLVPGSYVARTLDDAGATLTETGFEVEDVDLRIVLP